MNIGIINVVIAVAVLVLIAYIFIFIVNIKMAIIREDNRQKEYHKKQKELERKGSCKTIGEYPPPANPNPEMISIEELPDEIRYLFKEVLAGRKAKGSA